MLVSSQSTNAPTGERDSTATLVDGVPGDDGANAPRRAVGRGRSNERPRASWTCGRSGRPEHVGRRQNLTPTTDRQRGVDLDGHRMVRGRHRRKLVVGVVVQRRLDGREACFFQGATARPASASGTSTSRSRSTRAAGSGHQPSTMACQPFSGMARTPASASVWSTTSPSARNAWVRATLSSYASCRRSAGQAPAVDVRLDGRPGVLRDGTNQPRETDEVHSAGAATRRRRGRGQQAP